MGARSGAGVSPASRGVPPAFSFAGETPARAAGTAAPLKWHSRDAPRRARVAKGHLTIGAMERACTKDLVYENLYRSPAPFLPGGGRLCRADQSTRLAARVHATSTRRPGQGGPGQRTANKYRALRLERAGDLRGRAARVAEEEDSLLQRSACASPAGVPERCRESGHWSSGRHHPFLR